MKKINSVPSFVRQQLKIKGRSQHNGRGTFEMDYDVDHDVLQERLELKLLEWYDAKLIDTVEITQDAHEMETIHLYFKTEVVRDPYYRLVNFNPYGLFVSFSLPERIR